MATGEPIVGGLVVTHDIPANSTAAAQDKFYSILRGFIIAQLRKETE